jgi:uncharacterized protein YbjT (DUF2867 family)
MFVVTGASGNTGSVVATTLLERGEKVRAVVRDEARGAALRARGAEVHVARLEDAAALTAALRGAEGAYLIVPPDYTSKEFLAGRRVVVDAYAQALEASPVPRAVVLSSVGADGAGPLGLIASIRYAEQRLARARASVTFLRASYFLENWLSVLPVAREHGVLPTLLREGRAIPMVSTVDIGRVAADLLRASSPPGPIVALTGPSPVSPDDVAAALGRALGKPIATAPVPDAEIVGVLESGGFSNDVARLFREMVRAIDDGSIAFRHEDEARTVRGTTTLDAAVARWLA